MDAFTFKLACLLPGCSGSLETAWDIPHPDMAFGVAVAVVSHSLSPAGLVSREQQTWPISGGLETPEVHRGAGQHPAGSEKLL